RTLFSGGQTVTVEAPWGQPPFFVRAGSVLPVNLAEQHFSKPAGERGFEVFPTREGHFVRQCFEDDGETFAHARGQSAMWRIEGDAMRLSLTRAGPFGTPPKAVKLILPPSE